MTSALQPRLVVALILVAGVAAAWSGVSISHGLQDAALARESQAVSQRDTAGLEETRARLDLIAATSEHAQLASVAAERPTLLDALTAAKSALAAAEGKVDVDAQRHAIIDAENRGFAERGDPAVVRAAAETIRTATGEVTAAVDASARALAAAASTPAVTYSASQVVGAPASGTQNGQDDWFAQARALLDRVGGSGIELRAFDGGCGDVVAGACAFVPAYIAVTPAFAELSSRQKIWTLTHEVAHFSEMNVWFDLQDSPRYQQLFGDNPERLANCMAQVRGAYSGCSSDEVDFAAGVWNGVVS